MVHSELVLGKDFIYFIRLEEIERKGHRLSCGPNEICKPRLAARMSHYKTAIISIPKNAEHVQLAMWFCYEGKGGKKQSTVITGMTINSNCQPRVSLERWI